jgi:hypothetical protein
MAISKSTGFITYVNGTGGGVLEALNGGSIVFYNGTPPANADAAATGTLLWTVLLDGEDPLVYEVNAQGRAAKPAAAQWGGATTAGTPTYWRAITAADTGALSTTERRVQGTCGNGVDVDLYLDNPVLTTDAALDAKLLNAFTIGV